MAEEQLEQLQAYLAQASVAYQREIVRLRQALGAAATAAPARGAPAPGTAAVQAAVAAAAGGEGTGGGAELQLPPLAR